MAMNKFMHPRNIYKNPPNFRQLAIEYPEFKKFLKVDISGKVVFDFKDIDSLRALSRTLLKKDFNLDVEIPNTKLVPTIPLRLNYLLWIEDILNYIGQTKNVKGIDIGTGASCVYPLMAAKSKNWFMTATEIDTESIEFAKKNIEQNHLNTFISLVKVSGETLLKDLVSQDTEYDFCMCNPPFFSSPQELHPFFKSRKQNRSHPKNAFVANVNEVVSKGGEVQFIKKIIKESSELQTKVKIYTSMVGHKSSLPPLKLFLREMKVHSFKETEFCQGNTTRWGLAWTYSEYDLLKMPDLVKLASKTHKKTNKPLRYIVPIKDTSPEILNKITLTVLKMFRDLEMTCEEVTRNKMNQRFFVTAHANTWSNQRRKRRENQKKMPQSDEVSEKNNNEKLKESDDCSVEVEVKSPGKRTLDEICDGVFQKKLRLEESETSLPGIDIGTGASCVYPLMAAKSKNWFMTATEIDTESIEFAKKNIEQNHLNTFISLVKVSGETLLKDLVSQDTEYDFCMCNPPFFSSPQELHPFFKSRKQNRSHPKNAFVANVNEVVSKGGEVQFIKKIIKESSELQTKVKIYTSMVGHKSSLPPLKLFLREMKVHSFKETEFCQGNTTRWGLAWTYSEYDLLKMPDLVKLASKTHKKTNKPLRYIVPIKDTSPEILNKITLTVLKMFRDLEMTCEEVTRNKMNQRFFVTAHANTWSNQRRKRRENQKKMPQSDEVSEKNNNEKLKESDDCSVEVEVKSPGKRTLDEICDGVFQKKLRLEESETSLPGSSVFFKFIFSVIYELDTIVFELNTIEESGNKEYLCQVFQYIRNNFKIEEILKVINI